MERGKGGKGENGRGVSFFVNGFFGKKFFIRSEPMRKNFIPIIYFFCFFVLLAGCDFENTKTETANSNNVVAILNALTASTQGSQIVLDGSQSYYVDQNYSLTIAKCEVVLPFDCNIPITQVPDEFAKFTCCPKKPDTYTFKLTVARDKEEATDVFEIEVVPLTLQPCSYKQGDNFITVASNGGDDAMYRFHFGQIADPPPYDWQSSTKFAFTPEAGKTYYCWAEVNNGGIVVNNQQDKLIFTIPPDVPVNLNPDIIDFSDPNISTTVGMPIQLFVQANDPDGNNGDMVYDWESTGNCAVFSNPNSSDTTVTYSLSGIYTATVSVRDNEGGMSQRATKITVANVVAPQEDDPNSLYADGNIVASTHIILYKKTGEIEVDIRPLLDAAGLTAFDAGGVVFLWGALNSWNPTESFQCEVVNGRVLIDISALHLEGDKNYGVSFVIVLQGNFFWQDLLMFPDDLLLMGKDAGGGSVLAFHLNTDGAIDNLPPGTVVEN